MKKIIIIGCPGSGKSTFSRKLNDILNYPIYHLDMIWHNPDKTTISREAFDEKLEEIFKTEKWIIDGNYSRTIEKRLKACDTVFLLDIPTDICIEGAKSRIGTKREDLPWIEEELDEDFKEKILEFSANKLPQIYQLLEEYKDGREINIFKSREEIDNYINNLLDYNGVKINFKL